MAPEDCSLQTFDSYPDSHMFPNVSPGFMSLEVSSSGCALSGFPAPRFYERNKMAVVIIAGGFGDGLSCNNS